MSGAVAGKPSPKCKDCGKLTDRVVTITVQWPQGSEKRHEWLCADCEYLREKPDAPPFVKPPRERSKRLQKETFFDLLA